MDVNIEKYCRICLDVDSKHVSILEDSPIQLHLKSCLALHINENDNLPKSVCESCVSQLSNFYDFQLNARYSQDYLETSLQEKRKPMEQKACIQPLPDSEYNSDSLLEFLNNTTNIEEYLNNLGREDIPAIVNMLDKTDSDKVVSKIKLASPKKKPLNMDIDILDSDLEIVKELLLKESQPKDSNDNLYSCFACKEKSDSIQSLSRHLSVCEGASRTCVLCKKLFNSKQKMIQHFLTHNITAPLTCTCGKQFETNEKLMAHTKYCNVDHIASMGFIYRCKQCKETFTERFQLYKHARRHIVQEEQKMCDVCGHTFLGSELLSRHMKEKHNLAHNCRYKCKLCKFSTTTRKDMYQHAVKHNKGSEKHLCETCGKCFSSKLTLSRHASQHMSSRSSDTVVILQEKRKDDTEVVMCEKCGETVICTELNKHKCM